MGEVVVQPGAFGIRLRNRSRSFGTTPPIGGGEVKYHNGDSQFNFTFGPYKKDKGNQFCHDQINPGPPYYRGGALFIRSEYHNYYTTAHRGWYYNQWATGDFTSGGPWTNPGDAPYTLSSTNEAESIGAAAYAKFRPDAPVFDLARFAGELKDFSHLMRQRASDIRDIGSAYLAYEFGLKPFYKDLKDYLTNSAKVIRRYNELVAHQSKGIRVSAKLFESSDTSQVTVPWAGLPYNLYPTYFASRCQHDRYSVHTESFDNAWFVGKFRYDLPSLKQGKIDPLILSRLAGVSPTLAPSLIWELTPFSFLIDYFSNLGDVIRNLSPDLAISKVASEYAYTMRHKGYVVTARQDYRYRVGKSGSYWRNGSVATVSDGYTKSRINASPFGFSGPAQNLTPGQLGILSALGISFLPRKTKPSV